MKCTHPGDRCSKQPAVTEWGNSEACNCELVRVMERDYGEQMDDCFDDMKGDGEGCYDIKRWFINKDGEHEQGEFNRKCRPIRREGRSLRINYFSGWVRISRFSRGVQHGM